jgi:hypothetical protein
LPKFFLGNIKASEYFPGKIFRGGILLDSLPLILQIIQFFLPVTAGGEIRIHRSLSVFHGLMSAPGAVMDKTHCPERFDQTEAGPVKVTEGLITIHEQIQLNQRLFRRTGQKHPYILHRGTDNHVIEIKDIQRFTRPMDQVAAVAVAMNPDHLGMVEQWFDGVN